MFRYRFAVAGRHVPGGVGRVHALLPHPLHDQVPEGAGAKGTVPAVQAEVEVRLPKKKVFN